MTDIQKKLEEAFEKESIILQRNYWDSIITDVKNFSIVFIQENYIPKEEVLKLINDEIATAHLAGQPTSRLTSLAVRVSNIEEKEQLKELLKEKHTEENTQNWEQEFDREFPPDNCGDDHCLTNSLPQIKSLIRRHL